MQVIKPSAAIVSSTPDGYSAIEKAARLCYLSEPMDTPEMRDEYRKDTGSDPCAPLYDEWVQEQFIKKLMDMGHKTPFEHMDITVEFTIDRGVSHELVRNRMCSPMQESTRYCNYGKGKFGKEITVIEPMFFDPEEKKSSLLNRTGTKSYSMNKFDIWYRCMEVAQWGYMALLNQGATPQEARSVLPNSLKTKLLIKANVVEWWHIMWLRAVNPKAHPQVREVMVPLLMEFANRWETLFQHQLDKLKENEAPIEVKRELPPYRNMRVVITETDFTEVFTAYPKMVTMSSTLPIPNSQLLKAAGYPYDLNQIMWDTIRVEQDSSTRELLITFQNRKYKEDGYGYYPKEKK